MEAMVEGGALDNITLSKTGTTELVVPAKMWYIVYWLYAVYIASAAVADRTALVTHYIDAEDAYLLLGLSGIAASQTRKLVWGQGLNASAVDPQLIAPGAGPLWLAPASKILMATINEQAGDDWRIKGVYRAIPQTRP